MRLFSLLAAALILAGTTIIAVATMQLHGPQGPSATVEHPVNQNSINRLPTPPNLPIVPVEDAH